MYKVFVKDIPIILSTEKKIGKQYTAIPLKLARFKKLIKKTDDMSYRYLGGAVGNIDYDAIRLFENIPGKKDLEKPIMEFGIYNDGILYDNKKKQFFYFYYDEDFSLPKFVSFIFIWIAVVIYLKDLCETNYNSSILNFS